MRKLIVAVLLAVVATAAYAACRSFTVNTPDGRVLFCTECCYYGNCTVTCN